MTEFIGIVDVKPVTIKMTFYLIIKMLLSLYCNDIIYREAGTVYAA